MATIAELLTLTQPDAQQTAVSQGTGLNDFANTYKDALRAALNDTSAILGMYTNITQDGRAQRYNNEVGEATPIQQLAVILCNEFYPDTDALQSWRYDGFKMAVGAITECLKLAKDNDTQIYPIQWPRVCFDVEKGINPHKKDGLILCGMDPLSKGDARFKATGFAFNYPGATTNTVACQQGMIQYYGIDCSGEQPRKLLANNNNNNNNNNNKVVMVNMIRTIFEGGTSTVGNAFEDAWTDYTTWFLRQFPKSHIITMQSVSKKGDLPPLVASVFYKLGVATQTVDPQHVLFWPRSVRKKAKGRMVLAMKDPAEADLETWPQLKKELGAAFNAIYDRVPSKHLPCGLPGPVQQLMALTLADAFDVKTASADDSKAFATRYRMALKRAMIKSEIKAAYKYAVKKAHRADKHTQQMEQLAFVLCDTFYSKATTWNDGFEKAVEAVRKCLELAKGKYLQIYPIQWPRVCFDVENAIEPHDGEGLILCGMDPLGIAKYDKNGNRFKATGIAFHLPGAQDVGSLTGMIQYYGIDCSGEQPRKLLANKVVMVNMIRTIFEDDPSASGNRFHDAWTDYTVWFLQQFSKSHIIVFNYPYNSRLADIVKEVYEATTMIPSFVQGPPTIQYWPRRHVIVMDHPSRMTNSRFANARDDDVKNGKAIRTPSVLGVLGIDTFQAIYRCVPLECLVEAFQDLRAKLETLNRSNENALRDVIP